MWHRRPHHPCRRLLELPGVVSLGGWRREAAEEEEGRRQGRQLVVRGHDALDSVLTSCRLVFEPCLRRRHHHPAFGRPPRCSLTVFCYPYPAQAPFFPFS